MDFKLFSTLSVLMIVVSAAPKQYPQYQEVKEIHPTSYGAQDSEDAKDHYIEDSYGPAEYEFKYGVHDAHTGDIKSHEEERKGDVVHGRYELVDSDGFLRIVEYTADDHHGFQAIVRREPTDVKIPIPEHQPYVESATPYHTPKKYYVSSTATPLSHYSPSNYGGSGTGAPSATGYSVDQGEEEGGVSIKYKH